MKKGYTIERNIQILISLLKQHDIRDIIINPGTTNISFAASIQNDDFFTIHSCVDERSSAYLACGIAAQKNKPVVITCTGATASRNYVPGMTEAYYRKLPVIAVTASQHPGRVGHNVPQVIDRTVQMNDIVTKSVQLNIVHSEEDAWAANVAVNDALLECRNNGGGPVHINLITTYEDDFSVEELPVERMIERKRIIDDFPSLENKNVIIYIGNHSIFTEDETRVIEKFCEMNNAVVVCDYTSNYNGKYKILGNLLSSQMNNISSIVKSVDVLIDIGNVSGAYIGIRPKEVWRVNPDGVIRDTFKKLRYIFSMDEFSFFYKMNSLTKKRNGDMSYYKKWKNDDSKLREKLSNIEIPFSNPWIASQLIKRVHDFDIIHVAILNTLRSWNLFDTDKKINVYCNTGGFGIDGIVSTALGASMATDKNIYCIVGDLAFFYDLNSIGNRELKNNLKIILINNGCGTEFHNFNHRAVKVADIKDISLDYFAADGHFGNKSQKLVKHYAEDLGFKYITASNKEEFIANIDTYFNIDDQPVIFEVFTNPEDESEALKKIYDLDDSFKSRAKKSVKKILGEKRVEKVKKIVGK